MFSSSRWSDFIPQVCGIQSELVSPRTPPDGHHMTTEIRNTARLAVACAFDATILKLVDTLKAAGVQKWERASDPLAEHIRDLAHSLSIQDEESVSLCVGGLLHQGKRQHKEPT